MNNQIKAKQGKKEDKSVQKHGSVNTALNHSIPLDYKLQLCC